MSDIIKVKTPPFRLSYPSIFQKARDMQDKSKETKYEVTMLFEPAKFSAVDAAAFKSMQELADNALTQFFQKPLDQLPPAMYRRAFRDGLERADTDGYGAGIIFAKASSLTQPGVVDVNRIPIITESEVYAGCWMRATVTAYGYDNIGKGVAFGLNNLQKLKDDANFSGRLSPEEDFDDDAAAVWGGADASPTAEAGDDILG